MSRHPFVSFAALSCGVLALAGSSLRAQLTHTVTAASAITCSALAASNSLPAGTVLSPATHLSASSAGLGAICNYRTFMTGGRLQHFVYENAFSGFPGITETGVNETLWVIQSRHPVTGILAASGSVWGTATSTQTCTVDIGNDGTIEWDAASGAPAQIAVTVANTLEILVTTSTYTDFANAVVDVELEFLVDATAIAYGSGCGQSAPLTLVGSQPGLGSTWSLTTSNIDPISPIAVAFFGSRGVAVPYPTIGIDAPGCFAHLSSIVGTLSGGAIAGSATVGVAVPNESSLVGVALSCQSVCLTSANPANLLSSNGLEGTVGF